MALHIRDFRQSDATELTQLGETAHWLGAPTVPSLNKRMLLGLRDDQLAGAIWFSFKGNTGVIPAILVADSVFWRSDVQELISEASLWLSSRGVARIELHTIPNDEGLLTGLLEMHFKADERAGTLHRHVPARSAA